MKALGACALLALSALARADGFAWFHQALNHSDPGGGTFRQRFWMNSTFSGGDPRAPVVFLVGGEMELAEWLGILGGQAFPLAERHNATILALEHRGFGLSSVSGPTLADLSLLTVEQAVEDVAGFRDHVAKAGISASGARWIAFGCSYSGMVAAFSAQLSSSDGSPVLAGAVASSAPLRAFAPFAGYTSSLADAFGNPAAGGSPACASSLLSGLSAATDLVNAGREGWGGLQRAWGLCAAPASPDDARWAWRFAVEYVLGSMAVQESRGFAVPYVCSELAKPGVAPVNAVGAVLAAYAGSAGCSDVGTLADYVAELRNTTIDQGEWGRQYTYLKCSALGWFHECDSGDGCAVRGALPLSLLEGICRDAFGLTPGQRAVAGAALNARFGGSAPPGRSDGRVQYVLGGADPWRSLGADASAGGFVPSVIEVDGGWHCSDMDVAGPRTPAPVRAARAAVAEQVAAWLH